MQIQVITQIATAILDTFLNNNLDKQAYGPGANYLCPIYPFSCFFMSKFLLFMIFQALKKAKINATVTFFIQNALKFSLT